MVDSNANGTNAVLLEQRVEALSQELQRARKELERVLDHTNNESDDDEDEPEFQFPLTLVSPEKKGYLFQWQDRSIGWGGTKWSLLFVSLERGRIACYQNHMDDAPVSVLTLRGCAVQDEGRKRNRRHKSKSKEPPMDEPGAYFHVFGIFHRAAHDSDTDSNDKFESAATLIPLLRFSTTSLAEKMQWMELISQTCAYCETDEFLSHEAAREAEKARQRQEQAKMALEMPGATQGTLPVLYFAPASPEIHTKLQRRRSGSTGKSKIPRSESFRSVAKNPDADKREAQYPPSKPMHVKAAPSYLSAEAPVQNYRGLFNLAIILLIVSNFRLIVDTVKLHGLALQLWNARDYWNRLSHHYSENPWRDFPLVSGFLLLQGFIVAAFVIEWLLSRNKINEALGMALHGANMHSTLLVSMSIVWYQIESPAVGAALLFHATITWMKLVSYACANEDYRAAVRSGDDLSMEASLALLSNLEQEDVDISYPQNVSLANLYYFWLAPTLTYQIAFPKTPRVRWRRVIGISAGLVTCVTLFTFLVAQMVAPTLNNLVLDLEKTNGVYTPSIMADYWLRLAIANTYLWLLMFYAYFHLYLNLWAEVLRFGDRVFYKDWWNSSEIGSYWRLWNMPVHLWLVRHLYFPSIRMNVSKTAAMFIVFTVSAILHEILVSVPFHIITVPWSFLGMMMQMPLVAITKYLYRKNPGSSIGNIIFWLTFCVIGQPMAILMYTADYQYAKHHAELALATQK